MGKGYEGEAKHRNRFISRVSTSGLGTDDKYTDEDMAGLGAILIGASLVGFMAGLYFLATRLSNIFSYLDQQVPSKLVLGTYVSVGTLLIGIALFSLREVKRRLYGFVELIFALVTAGFAIGRVKTQGDLAVWLALAASAYLVVRGLENLQKSGLTFMTGWLEFLNSRLVKKSAAPSIVVEESAATDSTRSADS